MRQDRYRDAPRNTWPVPVGLLLLTLLVEAIAVQSGRAAATLLHGDGWQWPSQALFTSLAGVLLGDASAGGVRSQAPAWLVLGCVAVSLAVATAGLVWLGKEAMARYGPGAPQGLANAGEARRVLGVDRLRRERRIVRPDLYGRRR